MRIIRLTGQDIQDFLNQTIDMRLCTLVSSALLLVLCSSEEDPIIETNKGLVKGRRENSRTGNTYYAFKGIPYARPPVGELRFKAPEEPEEWAGVLDGRRDAPHCPQKNYLFSNPKIEGSEDCLYLNVYTPKLRARRAASDAPLIPVMVFIHWGGFFAGYSSSDYLGPEYLMDKNVVVVTFNYRLGVLGFLSTNDDSSPGNYGLKDQVAALKWVQANIHNFWGDPDRVTIFGQSAGGASVHFHMLSPESRNLFHRAISQSGTALALWAKPQVELNLFLVQTQAKISGCGDTTNTTSIVECLRRVDALTLVESGDKFKFFSVDPLNVFGPAVEKRTVANPRPFITKQPLEYIEGKEYANVPWILGMVKDEGLIRAEALVRQKTTRDKLNESFDKLMPNLLALQLSVPEDQVPYLWSKIKEQYFLGRDRIEYYDDVRSLINLYTDRSFAYSTYQAALVHKLNGHKDMWFYYFNYSGEVSYGDRFAATDENFGDFYWGVSHCDDLLYLFKTPALFPALTCANDQHMIDQMVELWTNFAIHGDPTPFSHFRWEKASVDPHDKRIRYLNVEGACKCLDLPKVSMRRGIYKNRLRFWEQLPLYENIAGLNETLV